MTSYPNTYFLMKSASEAPFAFCMRKKLQGYKIQIYNSKVIFNEIQAWYNMLNFDEKDYFIRRRVVKKWFDALAKNEYISTAFHAKIRQMLLFHRSSLTPTTLKLYTGTHRLLFWRLRNSMCFQKHAIIRITSLWSQMLTFVKPNSVNCEALLHGARNFKRHPNVYVHHSNYSSDWDKLITSHCFIVFCLMSV
jgi:hypothetical protein